MCVSFLVFCFVDFLVVTTAKNMPKYKIAFLVILHTGIRLQGISWNLRKCKINFVPIYLTKFSLFEENRNAFCCHVRLFEIIIFVKAE